MNIAGMYGDQLWKAFKLTMTMVDAIREDRFAPKPATVKALAARGLMTERIELTDLGEHVRVHLMGEQECWTCGEPARLARREAQISEMLDLPVVEIVPIATTTEDSLSLLAAIREAGFHGGDDESTNEAPGDAERACQADEDAATYAEILAEQDADADLSGQDMEDLAEIRAEFDGEVNVCCEHAEVRCAEHVSIDAWLADLAKQDTADVMPGGEAAPWKSRKGKHGRHARKR